MSLLHVQKVARKLVHDGLKTTQISTHNDSPDISRDWSSYR